MKFFTGERLSYGMVIAALVGLLSWNVGLVVTEDELAPVKKDVENQGVALSGIQVLLAKQQSMDEQLLALLNGHTVEITKLTAQITLVEKTQQIQINNINSTMSRIEKLLER